MNHYPRIEDLHTIAFDFDGVFTDNKVWLNEDGKESTRCDRGDGLGISMLKNYIRLKELRAKIFILSKERNKVVSARALKMKCECHQGVDNKGAFMRDYLGKNKYNLANLKKEMIFVCNDLNDLPVATLGPCIVAPDDAHPIIKAHADIVIAKLGGCGFVREFVERLLHIETLGIDELSVIMQ